MRPLSQLISFTDALARVMADATPVTHVESIPVAAAVGRVAAEAVVAEAEVPPFHRAAMDGYAVVAADVSRTSADAPRTLVCVGRVAAGPHRPLRIAPGECAEIATGAPLPNGADAVVMVEQTTRSGNEVRFAAAVIPGQHVGLRGADLAAGDAVVQPGDMLGPAKIGALLAAGVTRIGVFGKPTVALVSTGDEIVEPGDRLEVGQIYDVNRATLAAIVEQHGGVPAALAIVGDELAAIEAALERAAAHDVIVFSGGSSAGDHDLVRDALEAHGTIAFHGIAVKPGKPTAFGRVHGRPCFGMPGNPTSCLSNGYLFLVPFLRRIAQLPPWQPRTVDRALTRTIASTGDRHQFYTVRVTDAGLEPAFKGSSDITSMANADGYIEIPIGVTQLAQGTVVRATLF
jgi:molybdopterin molybdotransferase